MKPIDQLKRNMGIEKSPEQLTQYSKNIENRVRYLENEVKSLKEKKEIDILINSLINLFKLREIYLKSVDLNNNSFKDNSKVILDDTQKFLEILDRNIKEFICYLKKN